MAKKGQEAKGKSSALDGDSEKPKMSIRSILKDIEFLGNSHMTWKQRKDLENKKVVSLGGKPPKRQRLPLSVARVTMKKQKLREEKISEENAILRRFGVYSSSDTNKVVDKRRPEDRVFKTTEGYFRNGVLDVKHMLQPSTSRVATNNAERPFTEGKKKKGNKKRNGKKKGGGRKRH